MKVGDPIQYRALAGDGDYAAEIMAIRPDGTVDIDVILTPTRRAQFSRIVVGAVAAAGQAFIPASGQPAPPCG